MTRIGLLLGSFDPIHIGHLYMATQALNNKLVDKVLFVPTFQNPWKEQSIDFWQRCHMIQIAIEGIENCSVCDIESQLNPPYYSCETLKALQQLLIDCELYIIVGADVVAEIVNWKDGDWILDNFKIITVARPGYKNTHLVDIPKSFNISSTEIRNLCKEGKIIYPLVPYKLSQHIKQYKIYE